MPRIATGKLTVIAALLVGIAAGGFAWWYRFSQTQRALAYWGGSDAGLILSSRSVEWLTLAPEGAASDSPRGNEVPETWDWSAGKSRIAVLDRFDISGSPGVGNLRQALVIDANLGFEEIPTAPPRWNHALRFTEQEKVACVLIDTSGGWIQSLGRDYAIRLNPKMSAGLARYIKDVTERKKNGSP